MIGEMLVGQGRLTRTQLDEALTIQGQLGGRLGTNLLELGSLDEDTLLEALGEQRSTRTASGLELRHAPASVVRLIPAKLAERYGVVPFHLKGRTLSVASRDPGEALKEDEIGFLTSCLVRTCVALEFRLSEALEKFYRVPCPTRQQALAARLGRGGKRGRRSTTTVPAAPAGSVRAKGGESSGLSPRPDPRASDRQRPASPQNTVTTSASVTAASPAPVRKPPPPQPLYIELDEEDAALLRSSNSEDSPQPAAEDSAGYPKPSPLPWLAREAANRAEVGPPAIKPLDPEPAAGNQAVSSPPAREAATDLASRRPETSPGLEASLEKASRELQHVEIRDDIADVLLAFCEPYFRRRVLLAARGGRIVGWRGEGEGIDPAQVREIQISSREPSVFFGLRSPDSFWLGALPTLDANYELAEGLGGDFPRDCLVLPVALRSRVVSYLYGDNRDGSVSGAPLAELRRLVGKAGLAFEVYLLKNKIRIL